MENRLNGLGVHNGMIAVTGITGHTGSFFLNQLENNNYKGKVRCLVRSTLKAEALRNSKIEVELVTGNLNNDADIRTLLKNVDTVVHIANIHYSEKIIEIGKECGVRRFILIHTTGVFSKHKKASQGYKAIENIIIPMMDEMDITILRPSMIFGDMKDHNISKFIDMVDKCPILPVIDGGHALIQPVNARDLANAIYKVLMDEGCNRKAYNISGERSLSIRERYSLIGANLNKKRLIISFPMWMCVFGANCIRVLSGGKIDIVEKVQRMGENRSFEHTAATEDFRYNPEKFEIGLKREVAQYIEVKNKNRF